MERIVAPLGLRVDPTSPWVDARLSDGSRVHTRFLGAPFKMPSDELRVPWRARRAARGER
jgi:Flp pilus assembly CpaF family ATPase